MKRKNKPVKMIQETKKEKKAMDGCVHIDFTGVVNWIVVFS